MFVNGINCYSGIDYVIEYRNLMVGEGKLDLIYLVTILSKSK
jgi:hypothetical protein